MRNTILALLPILAVPLFAQPQIGGGACTSATLTGSYSLTLSGRDASSAITVLSGVAVGVGTATFDGLSQVTFTLTQNSGKSQGIPANWSGSYSLQANCIGAIAITSGDSATFTLASYDQGVSYLIGGEDGTYSFTGSGTSLPATCSAGLLSGTYSFNGTGFALASGVISGVTDFSGLMQFNGAGTITTDWFISSGGTTTPVTTSGSYAVTSGCTGIATMADPSGNFYALQFTAAGGSNFVLDGSSPQMVFTGSGRSTPAACTTATLTGTRSLVLTGHDVLSTGVFSNAYYGVGSATFDGAGNVTFNLVASSNQTYAVPQILSGTYTLSTNCAGTVNITAGDTASFTLIPYNGGKSFSLTGQDATYSFTGAGDSPPSVCADSTLSGAYAFSGTGFTLGSSVVSGIFAITGLIQFDGAGAVSGSWSTASNQVQTTDAFTGRYAVSSSCVASATILDNYGEPDALTIALTSADGANFSVVGAFSTNLFEANAHSTFLNPGLAVGNAAGVAGGTPPGSLFSVYGFNLSAGQTQPTGFPLPITAAYATLVVNSESVPLIYVSPGQINAQMPFDIQPGLATVVVMTGNPLNSLLARSNTVAITVPSAPVPGVYVYGTDHAIAQNYPSYTLNSSSNAAAAGDVVILYFNGGGPVQGPSSVLTGRATPDGLFPVTAAYSATVDGVAAAIDFVGLTPGFVGLYQANLVIPSVPAGDHSMVLTIGGVASNSTTISTK